MAQVPATARLVAVQPLVTIANWFAFVPVMATVPVCASAASPVLLISTDKTRAVAVVRVAPSSTLPKLSGLGRTLKAGPRVIVVARLLNWTAPASLALERRDWRTKSWL